MPIATAGHYVLGTQGLALLRRWLRADRAELARRVDELAQHASPDARMLKVEFEVSDLEVNEGYARWARSYDAAENPLIQIEEPVVGAWIDGCPPGDALDAACGTGRHAAYLASRGHRVVGVDASPQMLEKARARVPGAQLHEGTLDALPLAADSVDLVVCALALTHTPDLTRPIAELARVLRPGGQLILSDLHPMMLLLGGTGLFFEPGGAAGNVRSYHHPISRYLAAFRAVGLDVGDCAEPVVTAADLAALSGGMASIAEEAFRAAWLDLPFALVWRLSKRRA